MDYRASGVDVEAGRAFVQRIRSGVEATHRPEVVGGLGGFGGMIRLPQGLRSPLLVSGTDGVGTKLELAQEHHGHQGVVRPSEPGCPLWSIAQDARTFSSLPQSKSSF